MASQSLLAWSGDEHLTHNFFAESASIQTNAFPFREHEISIAAFIASSVLKAKYAQGLDW
jgi:hypothetical protein